MKIDWKSRFTNKTFIASFVATLILLLQQLGLSAYIPGNIMEIVNTILMLLVMLGVIIDPSTQGISDNKPKEIDDGNGNKQN
jgi:phi LC3 family holin